MRDGGEKLIFDSIGRFSVGSGFVGASLFCEPGGIKQADQQTNNYKLDEMDGAGKVIRIW
jgi:hypothetical protein